MNADFRKTNLAGSCVVSNDEKCIDKHVFINKFLTLVFFYIVLFVAKKSKTFAGKDVAV